MITITDLNGKTVLRQQTMVEKGINNISLRLDNAYPAGVYLLYTVIGSESTITRIVKK